MAAAKKRLLLLMGVETYRATDFLAAARRLGVEVVAGLDHPAPLAGAAPDALLHLDFENRPGATEEIAAFHAQRPLDAVVAVDDAATVLAARACQALGLPGNDEEVVAASRDKRVFREILQAAGEPTPWFRAFSLAEDAALLAARVPYPCVLKPTFLNASRGVIRADDPAQFVAAFLRIARLLADPELRARGGAAAGEVLVESFLPGAEVALEGLMREGAFHLLAFFDKPDPLDGPYFEETLFVTPSRHPRAWQEAALEAASRGARALGLRTGPVHAELRLHEGRATLLEIATRSIGGHCSRTLRFGAGRSLEELILRHALGEPAGEEERESAAAGVMMIPVPAGGTLEAVHGLETARALPGIEDVEIAIPLTQTVVPWPEGHRYLGFIFARGAAAAEVEASLRLAHRALAFEIRPER
jgi:biotin carboxylase